MPSPFVLPTTSSLSFPASFECSTHPSLPYIATTSRAVLRATLKAHKRLAPAQRSAHLLAIENALEEYIPLLLALSAGLTSAKVASQVIDVSPVKEVIVEWRSTLSAGSLPGREAARVKVKGLDAEIAFTLSTLARTYYLLARMQLRSLHDITVATGAPSPEQRTAAIAGALQRLLSSHAVYTYLAKWLPTRVDSVPADISPTTISALASLVLAEATLLAVLKDDPYPSIIAASRNAHDKDWMVGTPSVPRVRAHLFARLCLAAAEHAGRGAGIVETCVQTTSKGVAQMSDDLASYLRDLYRTSRAKACRFLGLDAEAVGETGKAIAWLQAATQELVQSGVTSAIGEIACGDSIASKGKGLASRLKQDWTSRREDRRIAKDGEWGADAGLLEEGRILDLLTGKWTKLNDTVHVRVVPPTGPLLASLPSGREYHSPQPWQPFSLDANTLLAMRGRPNADAIRAVMDEVDSDDDAAAAGSPEPIGAFPGSGREYF